MIGALLIVWLTIFVTYWMVKRVYDNYKYPRIPGPPGLPILGNALSLWGKPEVILRTIHALTQQYTRILGLWIGPKLHVAVYNPKDAEIILRAGRHQVQKADEYNFFRPWLGDSILLSSGLKFKKHKRVILPAFNMNVLKQFIDTFNFHAKKSVKSLEQFIGQNEFDIHDTLKTEAMNVLLETTMGVNCDTLGADGIRYAKGVEQVCKIAHIRMYTLWLRYDFFFQFSDLKREQNENLNIVHSLTARVIQKRKDELNQHKEFQSETGEVPQRKRPALLDLLIEAVHEDGGKLTDQEIMDEVLTMMFAGQDTTAGTTGFALCLLGLYHKHQDRVHAELDEIFGDSDRDVTYDDVSRMDYLERVILETLRLYPAIPLIGKKPVQDIQLDGGYVLPKNCTVGIIIMLLHRNPEVYPKPHIFNPDNFLPERVKERHPYSFLPFSAGARPCVGPRYSVLKMKVLLSQILRTYKVYSTRKEQQWRLSGATTLKRRDGFQLRIERRSRNIPTVNSAFTKSEDTITDQIIKTMEKSTDDFKKAKDSAVLEQRDR